MEEHEVHSLNSRLLYHGRNLPTEFPGTDSSAVKHQSTSKTQTN